MRCIRSTIAALLVLWPVSGSATLIHVLADGTGDFATIAQALAQAASGDTVSLGPGVYNERNLLIWAGVQLVSDTGDPATTTIDAGGLGRCLLGAGGGPQLVRGITLRNGAHSGDGGLALLASGGSSRFELCGFHGGSAARGGAAAVIGGQTATFVDCVFVDNAADTGGAIYTDTHIDVSSCEFRGNTAAADGGAVFAQKKTFPLSFGIWTDNSEYHGNTAGGDGGAIHSAGVADEYYSGYISACTFTENAAANGGALRVGLHDCVRYCTFLDNDATGRGGAIYLVGANGGLTEDCDRFEWNLVAGNTASQGGAYAFNSSSMFLSFSTFFGNAAPDGGHFWMSPGSRASLWQSIVAFAPVGVAASGSHGNDATALCSNVFGNAGGDYVGPLAEEATTGNNISADPLFCDAPAGDFTLQQGSPCLPPAPSGCYVNYFMGRYGEGCSPVPLERESWGRIKSRWR